MLWSRPGTGVPPGIAITTCRFGCRTLRWGTGTSPENLPDVARGCCKRTSLLMPVDTVALLYDEAESRQDQLTYRLT